MTCKELLKYHIKSYCAQEYKFKLKNWQKLAYTIGFEIQHKKLYTILNICYLANITFKEREKECFFLSNNGDMFDFKNNFFNLTYEFSHLSCSRTIDNYRNTLDNCIQKVENLIEENFKIFI